MKADRWERIEQLCQEALERSEEEQDAFLESVCGNDQELRHEVASLLANRNRAERFIETPAIQLAARSLAAQEVNHSAEASRQIGRIISHYKVVEKLASGGMGDIYLAIRADGTYDKKVAVKMIQGARSTDFFLTRFQNERQILADLDHPNIARLLDGGATEEGLPYLVMEYIQGLPIDEYCAQKSLPVRQRVELFRIVCSAVQYAHQNLVVHRDLKPSNILVTSDGVPKLLDFGIAKILNPLDRQEPAQQTVTLMRMLTPDYASPEQVRNEPVSTASDVYSLGVILYALLTGQSPYRVQTDSPQELLKAICDTEPEKPSVAATRGSAEDGSTTASVSEPADLKAGKEDHRKKLRRALSGDLDNIVLKALKKEPQRRYTSVEQFSEDIRRYLAGLPVLAHPDSPAYRARKFIARHKLAMAGAALLIVSLAGGLIATLWQARIARVERARAERRFNDVRTLANSLIFDVHDSIQDLPGATAARKAIVDRALQYLDSLAKESGGDSSLRRDLATAYQRVGALQGSSNGANLGDTKGALESFEKAQALWEDVARANPNNLPDQINVVKGHRILSMMYQNAARPGARAQLEQAMALSANLLKKAPADNLLLRERSLEFQWMSAWHEDDGDYNASIEALREAITINQDLLKTSPQMEFLLHGIAMNNVKIANSLLVLGARREALDLNRSGLVFYENASKDPNRSTYKREYAVSLYFRCLILIVNGNTTEALDGLHKARAIIQGMQQADPANTLFLADLAGFTAVFGLAQSAQGQLREGLANLDKSLIKYAELREKDPLYQDLPALVGQISIWRGDVLTRLGNLPEAMKSYQNALPNFEEVAKASPTPKTRCDRGTAYAKLGHVLVGLNEFESARSHFQQAIEFTTSLASQDPVNPLALYVLADSYAGLGDVDASQATDEKDPSEKVAHWQSAVAWYEKNLVVSRNIQNQSPFTPESFTVVTPDQVRTRAAECERHLSGSAARE